ncbi:MAG: hypothetical protein DLM69_03470 [Candidatus Chloroheliales bacterium]|nr:MAG: hypothetical protein DLM69_03470 [Chloroflexota bacterium]
MAMEQVVKQEGARDAQQYRRRVKLLAAIYFAIGLLTITSMGLIAWRIKFWTTFSQRTNVETLTFALVFVLFAYLLIRTFNGFVGALRMIWYDGLRRLGGSKDEAIEQAKQKALPDAKKGEGTRRAYTDWQILMVDKPYEPIHIPLEDEAGKLGVLDINGVRLRLRPTKRGLSNSVFEYIANQIENAINDCPEDHVGGNEEIANSDGDSKIDITVVEWQEIDDDEALEYYYQAEAFRRLARKLESEDQFWPSIWLHERDVQFISDRMREVMPSLRDECFLPDLEYSAEYKVPIIPEPLGFVALSRNESRADPVATMGCAAVIAAVLTALMIYLLIILPWVPGK